MTVDALAQTGSDVLPWLILAAVIVVLGVIALVVARVVRSRKTPAATGGEDEQISPDSSQ